MGHSISSNKLLPIQYLIILKNWTDGQSKKPFQTANNAEKELLLNNEFLKLPILLGITNFLPLSIGEYKRIYEISSKLGQQLYSLILEENPSSIVEIGQCAANIMNRSKDLEELWDKLNIGFLPAYSVLRRDILLQLYVLGEMQNLRYGIRIDCIDMIFDLTQKKTMRDICRDIVESQTRNEKCSYCVKLLRQGHRAIGIANVFISHAWNSTDCNMYESLMQLRYSNPNAIVWIDIFSHYQFSVNDNKLWFRRLQSVINQTEFTLLTFDKAINPTSLSRSWCLFEIYCTYLADHVLTVGMGQWKRQELKKLLARHNFAEVFNINMEESQGEPTSRAQILNLVNNKVPGGCWTIDLVVKSTIEDWYLLSQYEMAVYEMIWAESLGVSQLLFLYSIGFTVSLVITRNFDVLDREWLLSTIFMFSLIILDFILIVTTIKTNRNSIKSREWLLVVINYTRETKNLFTLIFLCFFLLISKMVKLFLFDLFPEFLLRSKTPVVLMMGYCLFDSMGFHSGFLFDFLSSLPDHFMRLGIIISKKTKSDILFFVFLSIYSIMLCFVMCPEILIWLPLTITTFTKNYFSPAQLAFMYTFYALLKISASRCDVFCCKVKEFRKLVRGNSLTDRRDSPKYLTARDAYLSSLLIQSVWFIFEKVWQAGGIFGFFAITNKLGFEFVGTVGIWSLAIYKYWKILSIEYHNWLMFDENRQITGLLKRWSYALTGVFFILVPTILSWIRSEFIMFILHSPQSIF